MKQEKTYTEQDQGILHAVYCPECYDMDGTLTPVTAGGDDPNDPTITCDDHGEMYVTECIQKHDETLDDWDPEGNAQLLISGSEEYHRPSEAWPDISEVLNMDRKPKTIHRDLPCELSPDRERELGLKLSNILSELGIKQAERKQIMSELKEEIDDMKGELNQVSKTIQEGEEYREVDCGLFYDWEKDRRYLVRLDTDEIVESSDIPASERQQSAFPEAETASDQPEASDPDFAAAQELDEDIHGDHVHQPEPAMAEEESAV